MTGSQRLQKRPHSSTYPLIMSHVVCEGSSVANCDAVIVAPEYIVRGTKHMSSHMARCRGPVAPISNNHLPETIYCNMQP